MLLLRKPRHFFHKFQAGQPEKNLTLPFCQTGPEKLTKRLFCQPLGGSELPKNAPSKMGFWHLGISFL